MYYRHVYGKDTGEASINALDNVCSRADNQTYLTPPIQLLVLSIHLGIKILEYVTMEYANVKFQLSQRKSYITVSSHTMVIREGGWHVM